MKKLNHTLSWADLFKDIKNRSGIIFLADRKDIEFDNIEKELTNTNFDLPFAIDTIALPSIEHILSYEAFGMVEITPANKMRMLVKLLGGNIWYEKIGNGAEWRLTIAF